MCFMGSITLNPHSDFHEVGVLLPHLTDEDAKAQRGEVIFLRSHSCQPSGVKIQISTPWLQSPHQPTSQWNGSYSADFAEEETDAQEG